MMKLLKWTLLCLLITKARLEREVEKRSEFQGFLMIKSLWLIALLKRIKIFQRSQKFQINCRNWRKLLRKIYLSLRQEKLSWNSLKESPIQNLIKFSQLILSSSGLNKAISSKRFPCVFNRLLLNHFTPLLCQRLLPKFLIHLLEKSHNSKITVFHLKDLWTLLLKPLMLSSLDLFLTMNLMT